MEVSLAAAEVAGVELAGVVPAVPELCRAEELAGAGVEATAEDVGTAEELSVGAGSDPPPMSCLSMGFPASRQS